MPCSESLSFPSMVFHAQRGWPTRLPEYPVPGACQVLTCRLLLGWLFHFLCTRTGTLDAILVSAYTCHI